MHCERCGNGLVAHKILVVEDGEKLRMILSAVLIKSGYDVIEASDGHEALSLVRNDPPDLITLDLMMPKMNGYEVCKLLKSDRTTAQIPILMLSACKESQDEKLAWQVGADRYLTKPFRYKELLGIIADLLRGQRAEGAHG